jgi:flavodoxin
LLAACSNHGPAGADGQTGASAGAGESATATDTAPDVTSTSTDPAGSNVLMVYFSRAGEQYWNGGRRTVAVGNTARVAEFISELIQPDVFRIEAADPYPEDYEATVDRNSQEAEDDARPAIASPLPDIAPYSTILLGSPVWGVQEPRIMRTFLDSVGSSALEGKVVHPFVTYAVSGMGNVRDNYVRYYPAATFSEGLAIRGEEAEQGEPQVREWFTDLGLL